MIEDIHIAQAWCDRCDMVYGWKTGRSDLRSMMKAEGWKVGPGDRCICKLCLEEMKEEEE